MRDALWGARDASRRRQSIVRGRSAWARLSGDAGRGRVSLTTGYRLQATGCRHLSRFGRDVDGSVLAPLPSRCAHPRAVQATRHGLASGHRGELGRVRLERGGLRRRAAGHARARGRRRASADGAMLPRGGARSVELGSTERDGAARGQGLRSICARRCVGARAGGAERCGARHHVRCMSTERVSSARWRVEASSVTRETPTSCWRRAPRRARRSSRRGDGCRGTGPRRLPWSSRRWRVAGQRRRG